MKYSKFNPRFPDDFSAEEIANAKTLFAQILSVKAHQFFGGMTQVTPKVPVGQLGLFNLWYTPGVSGVSTAIREDNEASFNLSNRSNTVAIVTDSTRVLGDGDVTPPGGIGVMEGKALLMNQLGGIDAIPLCIDSRDASGQNDTQKIIDFVRMLAPSVGAVNLEDISSPNCFQVLDTLQKECDVPVWHDDAQGTACVTLAALINALKLADKKIEEVKITLLGAGASNTTIARLCIASGANPEKMILIDSQGGLHTGRGDLKDNEPFYRKWELCKTTNPKKIGDLDSALQDADVLIALSRPGPNTIRPDQIAKMADKAIVFVCANPVPEIYPYAAKEAGAFIVATGRGDFPNQVNNSLCFPGLLRGVLMVRAKKITDTMAITAAEALAEFSENKGIDPENIIVNMDDIDVFSHVAASVAMQAIEDGVSRTNITLTRAYETAKARINHARSVAESLTQNNLIKNIPNVMISSALRQTISAIRTARK